MAECNPECNHAGDAGREVPAGMKSIMVAKLRYQDRIIHRFVNDSVLIVYSAGPISGQCMFKRFGLADSLKGTAFDLPDQCIDTMEGFFIDLLPMQVILPCMIGKYHPAGVASEIVRQALMRSLAEIYKDIDQPAEVA